MNGKCVHSGNGFTFCRQTKFGVCISGAGSSVNTFSVALDSVQWGGWAFGATKGVVKQDLLNDQQKYMRPTFDEQVNTRPISLL